METKEELEKIEVPKKKEEKNSISFTDGTVINNLKINYKNLFDFEKSYSNAKDLIEALIKKQAFDHETMIQIIYVGYLGTNPNPKLDYISFIESLDFDYKRDMELFRILTGLEADKNEKN